MKSTAQDNNTEVLYVHLENVTVKYNIREDITNERKRMESIKYSKIINYDH